MKIQSTILWLVAFVILAMVNFGVYQAEQLIATGKTLYLELAPVDPRSLIQGDYMRLDYALLQTLDRADLPSSGQLLVDLDEQRIGTQAKVHSDDDGVTVTQIADNQLIINFSVDDRQIRIGADNYFFQEGQAELFEDAEYAELRVDSAGNVVLIGLLDEALNLLGDRGGDR